MSDKKPVKKKKVPLGKPLQLSEDDLDRLSQVTPFDIATAKIKWRRNVKKKYRNLLDAKVTSANANNQ